MINKTKKVDKIKYRLGLTDQFAPVSDNVLGYNYKKTFGDEEYDRSLSRLKWHDQSTEG